MYRTGHQKALYPGSEINSEDAPDALELERAAVKYRQDHHVSTLKLTDVLKIVKELGYRKADRGVD